MSSSLGKGRNRRSKALSNDGSHQYTEDIELKKNDKINWLYSSFSSVSIITVLKVIIWVSLMAFFVEIEFGCIFFILSMFYFVITNTSKSTRKKGQLSAYSVFNPNCKVIDGTLTAEQFEKELHLRKL